MIGSLLLILYQNTMVISEATQSTDNLFKTF